MGEKENIKQLLQEAELYKGQGLLSEARLKYNEVSDLISNNDKIKNKEKLLAGLAKKIIRRNKYRIRYIFGQYRILPTI